jgi:hypothetical protein
MQTVTRKWKQLIFIPLAAVALFLFWDFAQRATILARLADREQQSQQRLLSAQATQTALVERKAYVQTDAYAEITMREEGWARPGDTVARAPATPTAIPVRPAARPAPAAKSWLDLLLGFLGWQ